MASADLAACPHVEDFDWPSQDVAQCPFPFYSALRHEAPVYKYPGREQYLVSRWEDIVYVSEHPEIFIQSKLPGGIPDPDGEPLTPVYIGRTNAPEHLLKRSLGLKLTAPERLRRYDSMVRSISNEIIDRHIASGEMEFHHQFGGQLPVVFMVDVLGLPRENIELFVSWYGTLSPAAIGFLSAAERERQERLSEEARAYVRAEIEDRIANPRDDYLTEMIKMQVERDGEPAVGFLAAAADELLLGGIVTTTHMLASAMMLLLRHPEQYEKVRANHKLIPGLIDETIRLESPIQYLFRHVTRDVEIGGVAIPAESQVAVMWASGNRDELRWGEDPDVFDVQRRHVAKHHLAFGRGRHRCLGAPLARLEGRIAFEQVLSRMHNLRLSERNDFASMENIQFRGPERVYIEFDAA